MSLSDICGRIDADLERIAASVNAMECVALLARVARLEQELAAELELHPVDPDIAALSIDDLAAELAEFADFAITGGIDQ